MSGRLEGKVAFITGAGRGQGRSHALRLAEEGADIIAVDLCAPIDSVPYPLAGLEDLEETVRLVEATGRRIVAERADVRDPDALVAVVEDGVAAFGRLDIVLANAGIASYHRAEDLPQQSWRDMIDINLSGVWWTCQAALPHLVAGGRGGAIVLTSSVAGLRGLQNAAHYVASKHALVGLMKALALELGQHSIRVNTIHPTNVNTGMIQNDSTIALFLPGRVDPTQEQYARVAQTLNVLPLPWVEPRTVSDAILFLVSDEGRYITGTALSVDAGMAIRW